MLSIKEAQDSEPRRVEAEAIDELEHKEEKEQSLSEAVSDYKTRLDEMQRSLHKVIDELDTATQR